MNALLSVPILYQKRSLWLWRVISAKNEAPDCRRLIETGSDIHTEKAVFAHRRRSLSIKESLFSRFPNTKKAVFHVEGDRFRSRRRCSRARVEGDIYTTKARLFRQRCFIFAVILKL